MNDLRQHSVSNRNPSAKWLCCLISSLFLLSLSCEVLSGSGGAKSSVEEIVASTDSYLPASPAPMDLTAVPRSDNASPPGEVVKLIFIHHSEGEAWLDDHDGELGLVLRDNNYFVSDANNGWGLTTLATLQILATGPIGSGVPYRIDI